MKGPVTKCCFLEPNRYARIDRSQTYQFDRGHQAVSVGSLVIALARNQDGLKGWVEGQLTGVQLSRKLSSCSPTDSETNSQE